LRKREKIFRILAVAAALILFRAPKQHSGFSSIPLYKHDTLSNRRSKGT
jgi:hypothetical protein